MEQGASLLQATPDIKKLQNTRNLDKIRLCTLKHYIVSYLFQKPPILGSTLHYHTLHIKKEEVQPLHVLKVLNKASATNIMNYTGHLEHC